MKKFALVIIAVFLCFTTCKKENISENLCYSSTLMTQVYSADLAVHGLTYNSNCLVYESTEPFGYRRYTYDAQNNLSMVEMAVSFSAFSCAMIPGQSAESDPRKAKISMYSEFEYDNALMLVKKSYYFINSGKSQLTSFKTYDYKSNRIARMSTFNSQGVLTEYHDYIYDDNGNVTKDDYYMNNSGIRLFESKSYEFDNKNNPYRVFACEGYPGVQTNRNNIIKETSVTYFGTTGSYDIRTNVYEYNSLGYPVKINDLDCFYGKPVEN